MVFEKEIANKRVGLIDLYFYVIETYSRKGRNSKVEESLEKLMDFVDYGDEKEMLIDFCIDNQVADKLIALYEQRKECCAFIKEKMGHFEEAAEEYIRRGAYDDGLRVAIKFPDGGIKNRLVNMALDSLPNYSAGLEMARKYRIDEKKIELREEKGQFN